MGVTSTPGAPWLRPWCYPSFLSNYLFCFISYEACSCVRIKLYCFSLVPATRFVGFLSSHVTGRKSTSYCCLIQILSLLCCVSPSGEVQSCVCSPGEVQSCVCSPGEVQSCVCSPGEVKRLCWLTW